MTGIWTGSDANIRGLEPAELAIVQLACDDRREFIAVNLIHRHADLGCPLDQHNIGHRCDLPHIRIGCIITPPLAALVRVQIQGEIERVLGCKH